MSISRKKFLKVIPATLFLPGLLPLPFEGNINSILKDPPPKVLKPFIDDDKLFELQQQFLDMRFGMFIHFNMSTYCDEDWADPNASPEIFNPVKLDCRQWAKAAKSAGMKYGALTTKHTDGFCIWPTKTTDHSVANSPFKRDVVKEYADAFRKEGLKVCLYYSILDIHHNIRKEWVSKKDTQFIKDQLTELFTNYGKIDALIIDSWVAGWSRISYEEIPFSEIYYHIKSLQPDCLITDHNAGKYPGEELFYTDFKHYEQNAGQIISRDSNHLPAEAGIPINTTWFWKTTDPLSPVKDPESIVKDNLEPLNQAHCNFILSLAPNRDGLIDPNALDALKRIGRLWNHPGNAPKLPAAYKPIVASNLAKFKKSNSSWSKDGGISDLGNNDDFNSAWMANPAINQPWYEIIFDEETEFNAILFVERRVNQEKSKIHEYELQYHNGNGWQTILSDQFPHKVQMHRFNKIKAKKVRIFIPQCDPGLGITEFCIYNE